MRTPVLALIIGLLLATTGFATAAVVGSSDLPASVAQSTNPGGGQISPSEGSGSASANDNGNLASTGLGVGGLVLAGSVLVGSGMFVRRRQQLDLS